MSERAEQLRFLIAAAAAAALAFWLVWCALTWPPTPPPARCLTDDTGIRVCTSGAGLTVVKDW